MTFANPPAFANDDAFFCRFFLEIGGIRDTSGRPLHEVDFRSEEHPTAFGKCPFHDSRRGYLINKEALTQITSEWAEVLEGVRYFKRLFDVSRRPEDTIARAWVISLAAMFAPPFLLNRRLAPIANGQIPTPLAGVFKIMLDVPTTIDLMLAERASQRCGPPERDDDVHDIREFADSRLILVNGDYACAGSPKLIDNVLDIINEPPAPELGQSEGFGPLIGDQARFMRFCHLMTVQYVMGLTYIVTTSLTARKVDPGVDKGLPDSAEERGRPSAYDRRTRIMLNVMQEPDSRAAALKGLFGLATDHRIWGVPQEDIRYAIPFLEASLDLARRTDGSGASDLMPLYHDYHLEALAAFGESHAKIEDAIGAPGIFAQPPVFGAEGRHPLFPEPMQALTR